MSKADCRRSERQSERHSQMRSSNSYAEKLPNLLEGKFMIDPKTGKRIHIDRLGSFTPSGHFEMRAHLVGDDPWQLASGRNSSETNQTYACSDDDSQASKSISHRENGGGSRCNVAPIGSQELAGGSIHGGANRRNSTQSGSQEHAGGSVRNSALVCDHGHTSHRGSLQSQEDGGELQQQQTRLSEVSEPEVAAGTPNPKGSSVHFQDHKANFDEAALSLRRTSQRRSTPYPSMDLADREPLETSFVDEVETVIDHADTDGMDSGKRTSHRASSQRHSDRSRGRISAVRSSVVTVTSHRSGGTSPSARRFSCGKESGQAELYNSGDEEVSIYQIDLSPGAGEEGNVVVRNAVSHISSDGERCSAVEEDKWHSSRRHSSKQSCFGVREERPSLGDACVVGLRASSERGDAMVIRRESSRRSGSHRPSEAPEVSEQLGIQRNSQTERRSLVSEASCDDQVSDGMVSVQFKDGQPLPLDRMPSVRLSNGQPFPMDAMPSSRSSGGRASGTLALVSTGRHSRTSSARNSEQPPTIWEATMESREDVCDKVSSTGMPSVAVSDLVPPAQDARASSTGMPSIRVSELMAPLQEHCPRASEDAQILQFQDTDGHVISLKRDGSCVNLHVNTILEQVDVRFFVIDDQKRSYRVSQLEGDFKPGEDLKRLCALRDAVFKFEYKDLPSLNGKRVGSKAGEEDQDDGYSHIKLDDVPRRIKRSGRDSPRQSLRTSMRSSRSAPRESSEARVSLDQSMQSCSSGTCEECSRQLESEHKSISDDESSARRYTRADCRFTRRSTSTYVGLTRFPKLHALFVQQSQSQNISGTECSGVKVLLEKTDHALKDHDSRAAFADLPELLKGLGDAVIIHTRNILEDKNISVLDGTPVPLVMLVKLVEVLDRIMPSDVASAKSTDTNNAVPTTVVWSGEMLKAFQQGMSSTGFLPACCDLLNGRYRHKLEEMHAYAFAGELELHALLAVRLALSWIPPAHIQGPCDTFCIIDGHKTLMMLAADLLSLVRAKSAGNATSNTLTATASHDCLGQLALVLESLLCGVRCDSSFMKFAYGQDQRRSSPGHGNGTAQDVYGSKVVPLAPMALNALEVLSVMQAPGLERDQGAAVDAAATAALHLLAQLAEGPINTAVVPANSISTAVCYLLASKPLSVRLVAALRALICRPSHQPGWFVGKRKAKFDLELRAAFNAADLSVDLVHCTQKALTAGNDQPCGAGDSWEEEAAVLKESTSKVCDLYGHVESIIKELNENRPEDLAELQKNMPRCECCGGESPMASTSCGSDVQNTEKRSVLGKLSFLHCQIRQSWCLAPYLKY